MALPGLAIANSFTLGAGVVDGTDTYLKNTAPDTATNYCTYTTILVRDDNTATGELEPLISWPAVKDSIYNRSVDSAFLYLDYFSNGGATLAIRVFGVKQNWVCSEAKYYAYAVGKDWATPGAGNQGIDIFSAAADTLTGFDTTATTHRKGAGWFAFNVTSILQASDGADTSGWRGFLLKPVQNSQIYTTFAYVAVDHATSAKRPQIEVFYSTGSCTAPTNSIEWISTDTSNASRIMVKSTYGASVLDSIQYFYDVDSTLAGATRKGAYPDSGTTHTIIISSLNNNDWYRAWSLAWNHSGATTCSDTDYVDCKTAYVAPSGMLTPIYK